MAGVAMETHRDGQADSHPHPVRHAVSIVQVEVGRQGEYDGSLDENGLVIFVLGIEDALG